MARLDVEEGLAREPVDSPRLTPPEIVDYLRSLPSLWAEAGPAGRQALVEAIFARLDVLGFQRLEYELTPDAIDLGLNASLPPILELHSQIGEFGRGERTSPCGNDLVGTIRVDRPDDRDCRGGYVAWGSALRRNGASTRRR